MALALGCDTVEQADTVQLDSTEVSVDGAVHEVRISGAGGSDSLAPAELGIAPGDVVRFVVADRRPHALTFSNDSLSPPVRGYLEASRQLRGPPLVNEGSSWVVVFEDAPTGRYPFHCRSHDAHGLITIRRED